MDLQKLYNEQTGHPPITRLVTGQEYFSSSYVAWLEDKVRDIFHELMKFKKIRTKKCPKCNDDTKYVKFQDIDGASEWMCFSCGYRQRSSPFDKHVPKYT
jgi:Zn ribbon nucleic-acid-binding protein